MAADEGTQVLDELLDTLDGKAQQQREAGGGDAIDAVLNGPSRSTRAKSLRDAEAVVSFRKALAEGMIQADTANQLLRVINHFLGRLG